VIPFTKQMVNFMRNTSADDLMQYDHFELQASGVDVYDSLIVKVSNIQTTSSNVLGLCLNQGILSNGQSGGCCMQYNQSSNQNDFEIKIPQCNVQNGLYYASVTAPPDAPANYTITATLTSPTVTVINAGDKVSGALIQGEVKHFRLQYTGTAYQPYLVLTLSGIVDGNATLYVHDGTSLAGPQACDGINYDACLADDVCIISVPFCDFLDSKVWYIAVAQTAFNPGKKSVQFGLAVDVEATTPVPISLVNNQFKIADTIGEDQYDHYLLQLNDNQLFYDSILTVELYTKNDNDAVMLYMNPGSYAGGGDCFTNTASCQTKDIDQGQTSCHFLLQKGCSLSSGTYYFSVYGLPNSFYGVEVQYTLLVSLDRSTVLLNATSTSEQVWQGEYGFYNFPINSTNFLPGESLRIRISDIGNGAVSAYLNLNRLAGSCPCYTSMYNCTATVGQTCDLVVPFCEFTQGTWYVGVFGL